MTEEDPDACRDFYSEVWRGYTTLAFLGGGALMLFSRVFAQILFADAYMDAWIYIPILTLATVFTALCTFLGSVYFSSKKTVWSMITAFVGAGLNVALNLLLIPEWGAMGASVATFASYFAVCILRLITTRRLIPFKQEWVRGGINTLLLGGITLVVTVSEQDPAKTLLMYGIAVGIYVLSLAFNARAVVSLLKNLKRMIRRS